MRAILFLFGLLFSFGLSSQTYVTISDGTYGNSQTTPLAPMYGLYDYSWSSSIYRAVDIGSSKTISAIAWYVDGFQDGYSQTGPYTIDNVQVYFAYTTLSGWGNTNNVSGLNRLTGVNSAQGITSWTKVYDGSITFNASDTWKMITLTTPFSYDGVTNLIVHVNNNDGSYASGYPIFHYTNYNVSTSTRTMKYGAQDGSMGPTSGTRLYARPDIRFYTPSTLPIELIDFKPVYKDGLVLLKWSTASESKNDYFTVEKSTDGLNFESIGYVKGAGESTQLINYQLVDNRISTDVMYYRLKQTDFDGKFTFSDIESILVKNDEFILYPNPVSNKINLVYNSDFSDNKVFNIYDYKGCLILTKNVEIQQGINNIQIDIDLDKGVYIMKFGEIVRKFECN